MMLRKGAVIWKWVRLTILFSSLLLNPVTATSLYQAFDLSTYPSHTTPPQFSSKTTAGKSVSLTELKGQVVLLTFWASWCAECRPEMPLFEQLHREFATQGLAILGINAREDTQTIQQYARTLGLTFPLVLDLKGDIAKSYGVIGLPTTILIGRDGQTAALAVGPRAWTSDPGRAVIKALLAESVAKKAK